MSGITLSGSITDVPGVEVGSVEDPVAATGCTVVLFPARAVGGVDIRGGSTGTRELALLAPTATMEAIDAILLTGGSAFGLDAAAGVVEFLERRSAGVAVGRWNIPIVPAAVLFDLEIGNGLIRPDRAMGFAAAADASVNSPRVGNVGAGCGATVGKAGGMRYAMKGGLGSASRRLSNDLTVGALVAVNSLGDVRDPTTGKNLAGRRDGACASISQHASLANTTLAVIATNSNLTKTQATVIAGMAHDGFARTIVPSHTTRDGDIAFAVGTGGQDCDIDTLGMVAAEVVAEAIVQAVFAARTFGQIPAHVDTCRVTNCRHSTACG